MRHGAEVGQGYQAKQGKASGWTQHQQQQQQPKHKGADENARARVRARDLDRKAMFGLSASPITSMAVTPSDLVSEQSGKCCLMQISGELSHAY